MHTPTFLLLLTLLKVFIPSGLGWTNGTSPNLQKHTTCYGNQDRTKCTAFNSTHCRDHAGYYLKICMNTAPNRSLIKLQNTDNNTHSKNNELIKLHRKKRQIDSVDQSEIFKQAQDVPKNIPSKSSMPDNMNLTEPSLSNFMAQIQNTALNLKNGDGVLNNFLKSNYKDTGFIPQIKGYKKVTYLIPEFEDEHVEQKKNNDINLETKPSALQLELPLDKPKVSANPLNIQAPLQKEDNSPLKSAAHQPNLLRQKSVNTPQQPAVYQSNIPALLQKGVNQQRPPTAYQPNLLWQKEVDQPQQSAVYKTNIPERLPKEVNQLQPPTAYQPNLLWQKEVNQPQQSAVYKPNIPERLPKGVNQQQPTTAYQPNLLWQKEVNQPQQPSVYKPNIPERLPKEVNQQQPPTAYQPNLLWQKEVNHPQQPSVYKLNIPERLPKEVNQQRPPTAYQPNLLWQKEVNQPQQSAVYKPNIPERLPKEVNQPQQSAVYNPDIPERLPKEENQQQPPTAYQPNLLWQKEVNQPQQPSVYKPNIPERLPKKVNQPRPPTTFQPNLLWQKELNQPKQPSVYKPNIPERLPKEVNQPRPPTAYQPNLLWQKEVNQPQQPSVYLPNIPARLQNPVNQPRQPAVYQPNIPSLLQNEVNQPRQPNDNYNNNNNNNNNYQPNLLWQKFVNQPQQPMAYQPNLLWQKSVDQTQAPYVYQPNIPAPFQKEVNQPQRPAVHQPNIPAHLQNEVNQPQRPAVYQPNIPPNLQNEVNQPQQPYVYQPNIAALPQTKSVIEPQQQSLQPNENVTTTEKLDYGDLFVKLCMPFKVSKSKNKSNILNIQILPSAISDGIEAEMVKPNPSYFNKDFMNKYQHSKCDEKKPEVDKSKIPTEMNIPTGLNEQFKDPPHIDVQFNKKQNYGNSVPNLYTNGQPNHFEKNINYMYIPMEEIGSTVPREYSQTISPYTQEHDPNYPLRPAYNSEGHTDFILPAVETKTLNPIYPKHMPHQTVQDPKRHLDILLPETHYDLSQVNPNYSTMYPNQALHSLPYGNINKGIPKREEKSKEVFEQSPQIGSQNFHNIHPQYGTHKNGLLNDFQKKKHFDIILPETNGIENNDKPNWSPFNDKHGALTPNTNGQFNTFEIPNSKVNNNIPKLSDREAFEQVPQINVPNLYYSYIPNRPNQVGREKEVPASIPKLGVPHFSEIYPKHMPHQTVQYLKRHLNILLPETHYDLSQVDHNYSSLYPNQAFHLLPYGNINEGIPKREEKSKEVFEQSPQIGSQNFHNIHPQYGTHKNGLLNDFQKKKHFDIIMPETNGIENNVKPNWSQFNDKHGTLSPNTNGQFNTFEIPNSKANNRIPKLSDREVFEQVPQINVPNLYYSYITNRPNQVGKEKEVPASIPKLGVPHFSQIYPKYMPHQTVQDPKRHLDILLPEMHYDLSQVDPNYSTTYPNEAFESPEIPYGNINERIPKREEKSKGVFGSSPQMGTQNFYNIHPQYDKHKNGLLNDFQRKKHIDIIMPETNGIENNVKPNWSQFNEKHGTLQPNANGQFNTFKIPNSKVTDKIPKMSDREVFEQIPQMDVPNLHEIYPKGTYQNRFHDPKKHTGGSIPQYSLPASYPNRLYNTNENIHDRIPNTGSKGTEVFSLSPQIGMPNLNEIPSLYGIQMPYRHKEINRVPQPKNHIDILLPETENGNPFIPKFGGTIPYAKENFNTVRTPKGNTNLMSLSGYPQVDMPNRYEFDPKFETQQPSYVGPSDPIQNPSKNMYVEKPSIQHNGKKASPHIDIRNIDKFYPNFNTQSGDPVRNNNREIYETYLGDKATPIRSPQNVYKLGPIYGTGIPYSSAQYSEIEDPTRYRYNLGLGGNENFNKPNSAYQTEIPGYNGRLKNFLRGNDNNPDLFHPNQHEFPFKKSDEKSSKPINVDSTKFIPPNNNIPPLSFSSINFNRYDPKYQRNGKDETDPWKKVPVNLKNTLDSSLENQKLKDSPKFTQPTVIISNIDPVPAVYKTLMETVTTNKGYPTTVQTDPKLITNQNLRPLNNAPVEADIRIKNNHSTNSSNTSTSSSHSNQETNVQFTIQPTSFTQLKNSKPSKIIQNTQAVDLHQKHTFNAVPNENSISANQKYEFGTMLNFPKVESDSKDVSLDDVNQRGIVDQLKSDLSKKKQQYLPGVVPTNNVQNEYSPFLENKSLKSLALGKANEMLPRNNVLMQLNHNNLNKKLQPDVYADTPIPYADTPIPYAETMDPNIHYEKPQSLSNIHRQVRDKFTSNGQHFSTKPLQKHDPKKAFYRDQVKHRDDTSYSKHIIKDPPWWADKPDGINWAKPDILKESSDNNYDDTPKSSRVNTYFKDKIFKHGVITYSFAPVADDSSKQLIREAVNKIQQDTCLLFREKKEDDDVNFQFVFIDGECCCATPKDTMRHQTVWMKRSCLQQPGGGLHALLHLLGLPHELRHQDRDEHLILYPNLAKPAYEWEFEKKLPKCASLNMPFDHKSVMNVPSNYGAINNETTVFYQKPEAHVVELNELSTIDIAKLSILYEDECKMRPQDFLDACY